MHKGAMHALLHTRDDLLLRGPRVHAHKPPLTPIEILGAERVEQLIDRAEVVGDRPRAELGLARNEAGLHELCGTVDVLIVRKRVRSACSQSLTIGANELARDGTYWLRWQQPSGPFEVRTAIPGLSRSWRVPLQ